MFELYQMNW